VQSAANFDRLNERYAPRPDPPEWLIFHKSLITKLIPEQDLTGSIYIDLTCSSRS